MNFYETKKYTTFALSLLQMYFETSLSVLINGNPVTTVVSVKVSNDAQKVGSNCDVVLPLNSYIQYSDPNTLQTYLTAIRTDTFSSGDTIEITASYKGYPTLTIFKGFIYDASLGMPVTVKCLDYVYFFNLGIFGEDRVSIKNKSGTKIKKAGTGIHYASAQFKDILQDLIDFVNETIDDQNTGNPLTDAAHCSLMIPTFDMELQNLTFINMSPASILEWFKKELGFNISFFGSQLYVNLASNTTGQITLNTGRNVIESKLQTTIKLRTGKKANSAFEKIRLKCWFIRSDGTRDSLEVGDSSGIQIEHFFYNVVRNATNYETLANAALLKATQHKYRGELEILLYPQVDLFFTVDYTDLRYQEKNGVYVVTAITIELGEKGFHQRLKVAWLGNLTSNEILST